MKPVVLIPLTWRGVRILAATLLGLAMTVVVVYFALGTAMAIMVAGVLALAVRGLLKALGAR